MPKVGALVEVEDDGGSGFDFFFFFAEGYFLQKPDDELEEMDGGLHCGVRYSAPVGVELLHAAAECFFGVDGSGQEVWKIP